MWTPAAFLHLGDAKMRHQIHAADDHHHALVPSVKICLEHRTEGMNSGALTKAARRQLRMPPLSFIVALRIENVGCWRGLPHGACFQLVLSHSRSAATLSATE